MRRTYFFVVLLLALTAPVRGSHSVLASSTILSIAAARQGSDEVPHNSIRQASPCRNQARVIQGLDGVL